MSTTGMALLGVVVFVVGIALSIGLHEVGHLVPAKRFGVTCPQYMIGFGPTLWSRKVGETEYGVKAVPLGGYVRMIGMFPPKPGRAARADSTGRFGLLIDQARDDAQREIGPEDADRLFYQRSVPQRLVIMLGGPVMNLVIAVVVLTGLVTLYGQPESTTRVGSISQCVKPVTAASQTCAPADPRAPAAAAGLRPGDVVTAVDGRAVTSWTQVQSAIRANRGTPMRLTVTRDGRRLTLPVTPMLDTRYALDGDGHAVVGADGRRLTERVGFLGVSPATARVTQPVTAVPGIVGDAVVRTAGVVVQIPQRMVGVARAAFGDAQRDPNGPIGIVGVGRLSAEIGSSEGSAAAPIGFGDRVAGWLSLLASLNLALFVFNLVPLLPLDGGHVAGALWEAVRSRVARLRGRPSPGPVDIAKLLPVTYVVASGLLVMSALLLYADIVNPVRLSG